MDNLIKIFSIETQSEYYKILFYLYETGLVTKTVSAIRAHAVEMGLVFTISTLWILTVFVESDNHKHNQLLTSVVVDFNS